MIGRGLIECRKGDSMIRLRHLSVVFLAITGLAFGQPTAANPPAGRGGAGRGAFTPIVIGPPAPVPVEVAIPRPTAMELGLVNEAVKRLIDADMSPAKPLLKKFEPLL